MQSLLLASALYLLELVNACTTPKKLIRHSTRIHGILSGGAASQGEVHSRESDLHECLRLTWWVPLSKRGRVYDSSSFAFGSEWCEMFFLPFDKVELSVHSSWLSVCILWGDAFWVKCSELSHRLCRAFASFRRSRCFAFAWLCWALPLSWGVMLCLIGCVEQLPLS